MGLILLIVILLLIFGSWPSWGYSQNWGYRGPGILGIVLVIIIILLVMGRL